MVFPSNEELDFFSFIIWILVILGYLGIPFLHPIVLCSSSFSFMSNELLFW